jgi:hypothetical protein
MPTSVGYALSAAAAITLLAGCSGSGSTAPTLASNPNNVTQMVNGHVLTRSYSVLPKSIQGIVHHQQPAMVKFAPNKKKKHHDDLDVYVSAFSSSNITCYDVTDKSAKSTGTITAGLINPQGEAPTGGPAKKQQLVVANTGANNVLVFKAAGESDAQECTGMTVSRTMNDPNGYPVGVAVADDGNTYVTNIFDLVSPGLGEVRLYGPTDNNGVQIGDPNLSEDFFVTVNDTDTSICVSGFGSVGAEVDCSTNGGGTWTNTGAISPSGFPGGLAYDEAGNLIVDTQLGGITEQGTGNTIQCGVVGDDCVNIAVDEGTKHIFTGDASASAGYELDWPDGSLDATMSGSGASTISAQPIPGN